jgi:hypothetical protein
VTIKEIADRGVSWASDYLKNHPKHEDWGISFVEIVRSKVFEIDGRSPHWPEDGAAAIWFARVSPTGNSTNFDQGIPYQILEFWIPDGDFARYMLDRGYYASAGYARLLELPNGEWHGSIDADGLKAIAKCLPHSSVSGGPTSSGQQTLIPPANAGLDSEVHISFAGHRIQECDSSSFWKFDGMHPLARGEYVAPSVFEYGYALKGRVFKK